MTSLPGASINPFATLTQLLGSPPSDGWERRVSELVGRFGAEPVDQALRDAHASGGVLDLPERTASLLGARPATVTRPAVRVPSVAEQLQDFQADPRWRAGQYHPDELLPGPIRRAYEEHLATLRGEQVVAYIGGPD